MKTKHTVGFLVDEKMNIAINKLKDQGVKLSVITEKALKQYIKENYKEISEKAGL
ncbi:hypothetical protein [Mycoplasmopsis felis]|uniref:hypothetical protein n=1 Tax=Mycoplasmopsis felis TaxID=33923 RepID=UPI002AFDDCD0|nr:hypothetical protein [Mycoplasmopsis felis]WQQ06654.1 hypothetical protein RRG37_02255 [Mycoplasmopsis felis]